MKSLSIAALLLIASALTPVSAADMTQERSLNVGKEPQNWMLHHGNYEGYRFSQLKTINASNVKDLKFAFSVGLGGIEGAGTRYKIGNLEARRSSRTASCTLPTAGARSTPSTCPAEEGCFKWRMDPKTDKAWAGDVACCGVNNRGVALWKDKVISITLDGRLIAINKATGEIVWERKIADPAIAETLTAAPLIVRDIAIVGRAGGEYGIRGWIDGTDLNTGKQALAHLHDPGCRRARQRDLEGRQGALEARRRLDLGDRNLRPRDRHVLPGHRQCRPRLGSGIPARRQQVGGERARALPTTARSSGATSTRPTIHTTSMKSPNIRSSMPRSTARTGNSSCTPAATASTTCSTASTARSWPASSTSTN